MDRRPSLVKVGKLKVVAGYYVLGTGAVTLIEEVGRN